MKRVANLVLRLRRSGARDPLAGSATDSATGPVYVPAVKATTRSGTRPRRTRWSLLGVVAVLGLNGCATVTGDVRTFKDDNPTSTQVHAAIAADAAPMQAAIVNVSGDGGGSIFASANTAGGGNRGMKLFQDNKARDVGDLLTIVLVESTSAKSTAKTAVTKEAGVGLSAPTLAGIPVTYKGQNLLEASIEGSRDFNGSGDSQQSNKLDGNITVTVVRNLGNGNLMVSGEKKIRLNQGDELVQVQGIVRSSDIGPDNRIPSDRVGDARIVYGGRGTLARSNAMGWLGRFFNSAAFPY